MVSKRMAIMWAAGEATTPEQIPRRPPASEAARACDGRSGVAASLAMLGFQPATDDVRPQHRRARHEKDARTRRHGGAMRQHPADADGHERNGGDETEQDIKKEAIQQHHGDDGSSKLDRQGRTLSPARQGARTSALARRAMARTSGPARRVV